LPKKKKDPWLMKCNLSAAGEGLVSPFDAVERYIQSLDTGVSDARSFSTSKAKI